MAEKSMRQKWLNKEITNGEYRKYLAEQKGMTYTEQQRKWAKDKGFDTFTELNEYYAKKRGYNNYAEEIREKEHKKGITQPYDKNKDCPYYLGVHIAERVLSKIFKNVERMPIKHKGYDFVCNKGHKIDVKSSCLRNGKGWRFHIEKNIIADYFLCIGFDDRHNLNPQRIWLFKKDIIVYNSSVLNMLNEIWMGNNKKQLEYYKQYEQTDKLEKLKECCDDLKEQAT